jgi:hypothetical protein
VFKAIQDIIIETDDGEVKIPQDAEFDVLYDEENKIYSVVGDTEEDTIHFSEELSNNFFDLVDIIEEGEEVTEDKLGALDILINSDTPAFDVTEAFCKKKLSESVLTKAGKKAAAGLLKGLPLKGVSKKEAVRAAIARGRRQQGF